MLIDGKDQINEHIDGGWKMPAKVSTAVLLAALPYFVEKNSNVAGTVAQAVSDFLPISEDRIEGLMIRGYSYYIVSILSALFSTKEKGAFKHKADADGHISTRDYKFPYTYNPATSLTRSVGLLRYLNTTWDQIPSYREVKSTKGIDKVQREIDDRLAQDNTPEKEYRFTMDIVEDALSPFKTGGRSGYPKGLYIKGMFVPAMYLKLRELYYQSPKQPEELSIHQGS